MRISSRAQAALGFRFPSLCAHHFRTKIQFRQLSTAETRTFLLIPGLLHMTSARKKGKIACLIVPRHLQPRHIMRPIHKRKRNYRSLIPSVLYLHTLDLCRAPGTGIEHMPQNTTVARDMTMIVATLLKLTLPRGVELNWTPFLSKSHHSSALSIE